MKTKLQIAISALTEISFEDDLCGHFARRALEAIEGAPENLTIDQEVETMTTFGKDVCEHPENHEEFLKEWAKRMQEIDKYVKQTMGPKLEEK